MITSFASATSDPYYIVPLLVMVQNDSCFIDNLTFKKILNNTTTTALSLGGATVINIGQSNSGNYMYGNIKNLRIY